VKSLRRIVLVLVLLLIASWVVVSTRSVRSKIRTDFKAPDTGSTMPTGIVVTTVSIRGSPNPTAPLIGETILRGYADTNLPPANDLTLMSRLMDNFTLLVKSAADRPLSCNEDWASAFLGNNPAHDRFLPGRHVALNGRGQLVDRWGSPLFFHSLGAMRFELRSAGPDKILWNDDDIHRNANGSFRHGKELNPTSLLESHP
jgi:hypothetical protein